MEDPLFKGMIKREDLRLGTIRGEVKETLKELADKDHQVSRWMNKEAKHFFWDNLSFHIHTLFDDSTIYDYPTLHDQIGNTVQNDEELQAILEVIEALDRVLDEIGIGQSDSSYFNNPLWEEVVQKATKAYSIFSSNDEVYWEHCQCRH